MTKPRPRQFTSDFIASFFEPKRAKAAARKAKRDIAKLKGPLNKWWDLNRDKLSVRRVEPKHGETFAQAFDRFIDEMPRKPTKFLAMVAEIERLRKQSEAVAKRKELGRKKYLKRMGRRDPG